VGLRDRALIAVMVFTFARIGAATSLRIEDVFTQQRRLWLRLHEKGGWIFSRSIPFDHMLGPPDDPLLPFDLLLERGGDDLGRPLGASSVKCTPSYTSP
jgi:hypothetical protein